MKKLLYVHGFASAGSSGTATHLRNMLYEYGVEVISPDIPVMPLEAKVFLQKLVKEVQPDLIVCTSMGGLYTEQMYGVPRILVNPSFHMARHLTFQGMGRREFLNKRQDGVRDFKVDKEMIAQFREVEKLTFSQITEGEKGIVWGLFGKNDKFVNCQPEYKKAYGTAHFRIFDGEHRLNDTVLKKEIFPLIKLILNL
ncbi:MAG: hypothetical protein IJ064_00375 [Bacteroidaceae bacterium]|nr:hypothetical protein [Bacteroidaceae bacterium]